MPVIRTIDAEKGLDIGSAPSPQVDTSVYRAAAQQAAALGNIGQEISQVAAHLQRRQEQTEDFSARIGLQQKLQGIQTQDQEALPSIAADGAGWHETRSKAAKTELDTYVATLPPRLQDEFRQRADLAYSGLEEGYAGQEIKQRSAWAIDNVKTTGQGAENAVFANPDMLEQQRAGVHDLIKSAPIGALEKQKLTAAYDEALEIARIKGLQQRDPEAAKRALGARTVGGIPIREPLPGGDRFMADPSPKGLAERGNIDLTTRPRVKNADGSVSTVRSMSFEEDGKEILVPTVSDDGKILSDDQAIEQYRKTGKFLAKFDSAADANAYAKTLHEQQARMISAPPAAEVKNGPPGSGGRARAMGAHERGANIKSYYQSSYGLSDVAAAAIGGHAIQENGGRSSGKPGDNGSSFGTFQWNGQRLAGLKKFAADRGSDWTDQKTQLDYAAWEGENGDPGARRAWRELRSARTVEDAVKAWMHFERPRGYSPDNPAGGHAYSARLANAKRLLGQSGGGDLDAGGGSRMVLGDAEVGAQNIPYEKRLALLNSIESSLREISVQKRSAIETAVENAPAAIQQTGEYSGSMPTRQDFDAAYGERGGEKYATFAVSVDTAKTVYGMQTMPAADIERTVAGAVPTSTGDGAALEGKRYDAIQKAAVATMRARTADPAGYVMAAMPSVRAAWQGVQPGSDGYASAVRATVEAQRFLGVPADKIAPLPDALAKAAAAGVKDEQRTAEARLSSVVTTVFSTSDPDQQQAIFRQMVKEGAPAELAGVMSAVQRGDRGAAERLFTAAVSDPTKMPGTIPETSKNIDASIQSRLMASGKIGDAIYGLSSGGADAYAVAQRDAPLIKKSVQNYLRGGLALTDAIDATARDMWGDVTVYRGGFGVSAQAVVPTGTNGAHLSAGLRKATDDVFRPAVEAQAQAELGRIDPKDAGAKSVAGIILKRAVDAKLDATTFRTYAPGRIGMVDDMTGRWIAGADGRPVTVGIDDMAKAGATPVAPPAAVRDLVTKPAQSDGGAFATPFEGTN